MVCFTDDDIGGVHNIENGVCGGEIAYSGFSQAATTEECGEGCTPDCSMEGEGEV
jgi:hypothetical protein